MPKGILISALMLLGGLGVYATAWENRSLYVPLPRFPLFEGKSPVVRSFRARSTEEHSIHFRFDVGDHPRPEVKRRLNIDRRSGEVVAPDVVDLKWTITDSRGQAIAAGTLSQHFAGFADGSATLEPRWPYLHLTKGEEYTIEIRFSSADDFLRSLNPQVSVTIDRGDWTDIHPVFPVLFPAAYFLFAIGGISSVAVGIVYVLRLRKNTEPGATDNPGDAQRLRKDH